MRSLISLAVVTCLWVVEVLSGGTRSWEGAGGLRGLVWGRASAEGAACWGPGVWPHPSHCRMFSVCHAAADSTINGILLMCPPKMAFSTRRGRCLTDRTRCTEKPFPMDFLNSTEVYQLTTVSQRNYRCRSPRPFCRNDQTLTICAPNFNFIGNITCSGICKQENGRAACVPEEGVTEDVSDNSARFTETTAPFKPNTLVATTAKYDPPVLNAELIDSAIKITSALGLNPNVQGQQTPEGAVTNKPPNHQVRPGPPAYTSPVFDFSSPPKEDSQEKGESSSKAPFSKPVVVEPSKESINKKPQESGDEESQVFTVEMVRPVTSGGTGHRPFTSGLEGATEDQQMGGGKEDEDRMKLEEKKKLEREKLEREKLEMERLEMERLETERLEKERLEKERLEKERLEKERLEKERLEKERLETERLEKERLEKERLEKENLEKENLEKEKLEKERLEKERLEKDKLEKERMEKERLEKERLEKERLEKERLEKERLEKERLEKERLEKERLEKERLEKERLEKEKLEKVKLEKERLEMERLEEEKLEKEKLEKEKLEKEMLEKEKLEKEMLEKERLEREKLKQERLEKERLEKEKLEKERLEKEKLEQERLEKERLEKEKFEKERLEKEKLEKEKQEKEKQEMERIEKERLEMEKLETERLELEKQEDEMEKWQKENEKYSNEEETLFGEQSTAGIIPMSDSSSLSSICSRPGLLCANSKTLVECSPGLTPLRAWDCGAFFARSATLMAKCEKDGCLATVDEGLLPSEDESLDSAAISRLCKRPGAQCADTATLIHCSDDLKTATIAVCEDLFPRDAVGAICDSTLEACVVGLGGDEEGFDAGLVPPVPSTSSEASVMTKTSPATTPMVTVKFTTRPMETTTVSAKPSQTILLDDENQRPTKPPSSSFITTSTHSPNMTFSDVTDSTPDRDFCKGPGLRCSGGQILEACEEGQPKPIYKMDCSTVVAHSLDARCEEHGAGEAVCMVILRRSTSSLIAGENYGQIPAENDVFTLELSVVDVTKTFEGSDEDIPAWNCSSVGQYCADDSTLLSCNPDYSLEFALSCGAIAPESVVAYCDYSKNACVVKKISDITSGSSHKEPLNNGSVINMATSTESHVEQDEGVISDHEYDYSPETIPNQQQWDFSTISQLYPPDVPQNAYGGMEKPSQEDDDVPHSPSSGISATETADKLPPIYVRKCVKSGPACIDDYHLGYCSKDLELQYALPCSALYSGDPEAICDSNLSACLPSSTKLTTTTVATTTTTMLPTTTTTDMPTTTTRPPVPNIPPFVPQQIPSNQNPFIPPTSNIPQPPVLQDNQFAQLSPAVVQQAPQRPGLFQFFQRPFANRPIFQQPPRLPGFLQNFIRPITQGIRPITQGIRPIAQGIRPGFFGSQSGSFPTLGNLFQGAGLTRPLQPLSQGVTPEDLGEENYNFEDPQYVHPGAPTSYGKVPFNRFGMLQSQESGKTPIPLISPDFYQEILKHASNQQQTTPQNMFLGLKDQRPVNDRPQQSYFDRVMLNIAQNTPTPENMEASTQNFILTHPYQKYRPSQADANGYPSVVEQDKTVQASVQSQGTFSQVNPLTWVDKVNFEEKKVPGSCKRPGMQCMDSDSLGACSEELRLQYVIPCRNLLPFITVGKAFCDEKNDACTVLALEESPEYPTDYTSYP